MNLPLYFRIAVRYLRGKGSANAVPILSRISMVAIAVSSCAMIILFSVFNGFGQLIDDLYKAFYPDIKITTVKGKFFELDKNQLHRITILDGVEAVSCVLEDNVLVNTEEGDYLPVCIKGVDEHYFRVNNIKPYVNKGNDTLLSDAHLANAIIGQEIAANLGINVDNVFARIMVFSPNSNTSPGALTVPTDAFRSMILKPDGTFMVQEEFDSKYILAPLGNTRALLGQEDKVSSIELKLNQAVSASTIRRELTSILGNGFQIATRYEQNKAVYMVVRSEKWVGYLILLFVLLIASFNMVSALSLLVLEKQKDFSILRTMGFLPADMSRVVLAEGTLWGLIGGLVGIALGLLLCWMQIQFGLVKIQGAFVIEVYPVAVKLVDVLVIMCTVIFVGLVAAIFPARQASKRTARDILATVE